MYMFCVVCLFGCWRDYLPALEKIVLIDELGPGQGIPKQQIFRYWRMSLET